MKAVVAIDSFKGSMDSMQAGNAAKKGILAADPSWNVVVFPVADGGEGTAKALLSGMGGTEISLQVTNPLGEAVTAGYGVIERGEEGSLAVMEMASAAGITLVSEKDPFRASTRGVGEMIEDALERGCRDFLIGIGGSATNDGGIGMLQALGFRFLDRDGRDVGEGAQALGKISRIERENRHPLLDKARFRIACDVTNPLCGKLGATYIYGPQKGVKPEELEQLDADMAVYARAAEEACGCRTAETAGAGAAGGLGFAFVTFLGGILMPGTSLVLETIGLERELKDADVVVVGEGRLDAQTAMGKAPAGVAALAKKYGARVIAFAGSIGAGAKACHQAGIDAYFPIVRGITTLEEAMEPEAAMKNMALTAEQVFRLL